MKVKFIDQDKLNRDEYISSVSQQLTELKLNVKFVTPIVVDRFYKFDTFFKLQQDTLISFDDLKNVVDDEIAELIDFVWRGRY